MNKPWNIIKRPDKTIPSTVMGTYTNLGDNMSFNWEKYALDMEVYCNWLEERTSYLQEISDFRREPPTFTIKQRDEISLTNRYLGLKVKVEENNKTYVLRNLKDLNEWTEI